MVVGKPGSCERAGSNNRLLYVNAPIGEIHVGVPSTRRLKQRDFADQGLPAPKIRAVDAPGLPIRFIITPGRWRNCPLSGGSRRRSLARGQHRKFRRNHPRHSGAL